ncbi:MAG: hypothetical protein JNJ73_16565 [Hyphomonadaceae bacterium]|nr:hypothetical protein [Hyphomonadaceae bacterium]
MNKVLCIAAAICAFSGAAFADEAATAERAAQQVVVLDDAQLDTATGGLLSVLNGFLSSNSGLVNSNVAVPINVSNISLLSKGSQKSSQATTQGIRTGNTGVIAAGRHD